MSEPGREILIVDDESVIRRIINQKLSGEGYHCQEAGDAEEALDKLKKNAFALVILDNKMPGRMGIDVLPDIVKSYPDTAVVMVTATADVSTAVQCLKNGAYDYFMKPFDFDEVLLGVQRALEKRWLIMENNDYRQHLEEKITEQTKKLRALSLSAITALVNALEAKDKYTSGHSQRVAIISAAIAERMGLAPDFVNTIKIAGLVHDVGKIGVRELILNKPARLTIDEFEHQQRHPEIGETILQPIAEDIETLRMVRGHHEHYDGTGYPDGLKGSQIPLGARILAVADAYEAMTSERPYRQALTDKEARSELEVNKGTQFDPKVVELFLSEQWRERLGLFESNPNSKAQS